MAIGVREDRALLKTPIQSLQHLHRLQQQKSRLGVHGEVALANQSVLSIVKELKRIIERAFMIDTVRAHQLSMIYVTIKNYVLFVRPP